MLSYLRVDSPEEVVPAEQLAIPGVALVRQDGGALVAPHTVRVPLALQHAHEELVQDGLVTRGARVAHAAWRARQAGPRRATCTTTTTTSGQNAVTTTIGVTHYYCYYYYWSQTAVVVQEQGTRQNYTGF